MHVTFDETQAYMCDTNKLIVLAPSSVWFSTVTTYLNVFSNVCVFLVTAMHLSLLRCVWEWRRYTVQSEASTLNYIDETDRIHANKVVQTLCFSKHHKHITYTIESFVEWIMQSHPREKVTSLRNEISCLYSLRTDSGRSVLSWDCNKNPPSLILFLKWNANIW